MNTKLHSLAFAALLFAGLPLASSSAQVGVSITVAPPVLPVIEQPLCPVEGYLWTPGYWGYDADYYWVPGFWAAPPEVGLLWTPPWWGFADGVYVFHDGYWGPTIGFYGGINYGFGYFGTGYVGGVWEGNVFRYNTAVTRVNTTVIHNTFVDRSVLSKQTAASRASFNGPGGVKAAPTAEQKAAENARHVPATSEQVSRRQAASKNRDLHASVNHGHPKVAAIKSFNQHAQKAAGTEQAKVSSKKSATKAETAKAQTAKTGPAAKSGAAEHKHAETHLGKATPTARGHENITAPRRGMNETARTAHRTGPVALGQPGPGGHGKTSAAVRGKGKQPKPEKTPGGPH
jgi:hypothetical protein